jgi:hypothetical protein
MGVILVPKPSKYKSIGVSVDTYEKIVKIAESERRNILQQLALIVDNEYDRMGFNRKLSNVSRFSGITSVIEEPLE